MSHVLRARALWKSYAAGVTGCSARAWVLRGASLEVERGECVVVLGARGAGTTTLLHCLAGFRRLDAGSIELALDPLLLESRQLCDGPSRAGRLLLIDDALLPRRHPHPSLVVREPHTEQTLVIATHELARYRDVADRVLLLHHGRLHPLRHLPSSTRVAEDRFRTPSH